MSIIIYGPPGSGKTRYKRALRNYYRMDKIVDGKDPFAIAKTSDTFKAEKTLYLTNIEPPAEFLDNRRVIHIDDALRELHGKQNMATKSDRNLSLKLQALAGGLDDILTEQYGSRVGFVLVLAPFGQPKTEVQYIGNVNRDDGMMILRMLFSRWQQDLPDVPTHEKQ